MSINTLNVLIYSALAKKIVWIKYKKINNN